MNCNVEDALDACVTIGVGVNRYDEQAYADVNDDTSALSQDIVLTSIASSTYDRHVRTKSRTTAGSVVIP